MERIDGQVMWTLFSGASGEKQQELLNLFCGLFVQLHALDWRSFVDDADGVNAGDPYFFVDRWLKTASHIVARFPDDGFLAVIEWLRERRDGLPCPRPSPVHNDFHPENVLVRDDGSAAVIDWTGFDVSDPRFDLAWTLVLARAYLGTQWRDRILREYARLAGAPVKRMEHFEVFACARRLFDVTVSLSLGADRLGMRPDAVVAMRQQMTAHRRVYELLLERTGIRVPAVEHVLEWEA